MTLSRRLFGRTPDGQDVVLFTLGADCGVEISVMTYGAILTSVRTPDREGQVGEITLGFDDLAPYLGSHPYFGATVGRFANRIAEGRFTLDGRQYTLARNEGGKAHLHGGVRGYDKVLWKPRAEEGSVSFDYTSPDGEEGYPGTVQVTAVYRLSDTGFLELEYRATTGRATPINLTNHAYWNLAGGGNVLGHELAMSCSRYLPVDQRLIPTGELRPVGDEPSMDFRRPHALGERISQAAGGYDHCYVIDDSDESPAPVLAVKEPAGGRVMQVWSTQPGVQLYSGNFLDGTVTGRWGPCGKHGGFCVETQAFPDAINQPGFPSCVLRPGEAYSHTTRLRFSTE